ncbi:MAG: GNA1162 family protein, partial [Nitrospirota bacterium]
MMRTRAAFWIIGVMLVCATGAACSPLHDPMYRRIAPNVANPIKTVAVLPLVNNSNDVEAPGYVREELVLRLQAMQYAVKPVLQTDQILRDQLGITLGRQLDLTTVQQLSAALGVDGLVFGALDDFATKIFGLLTEKRSRVRLSFVNASDGSQIWASGAGVIGRTRVAGGTAGNVAAGFEAASRLEA